MLLRSARSSNRHLSISYAAWPIFRLLPISLENRRFVRRFYNFCRSFPIPINFLTYYRWLQHLSGYTLISCSLNYRVWEKLTHQHRSERGFVVTWLQRGENGGGKKQRCIVKMKKSSRWFVYERRGETRGKNRAAFVASICYSRCTVFRSVRPLILIHKHGQSYTVGRSDLSRDAATGWFMFPSSRSWSPYPSRIFRSPNGSRNLEKVGRSWGPPREIDFNGTEWFQLVLKLFYRLRFKHEYVYCVTSYEASFYQCNCWCRHNASAPWAPFNVSSILYEEESTVTLFYNAAHHAMPFESIAPYQLPFKSIWGVNCNTFCISTCSRL